MFVRNLLQAGDYVTIVPAGIRITLQYDANGLIECVYVGYEDDKVLHPEILPLLLSTNEVPSRIPISKGSSFIYGCLYTGEVYKVEGDLNDSVEKVYVNKYVEDPSKFHFFAGHMQSYVIGANTPAVISRWLNASGFKLLPSYLVPKQLTEETFASMLNLDTYSFSYPRISGYIVFRSGKYQFEKTGVRQLVAKTISQMVSHEGYILSEISSYDFGSITVSYADVVNHNIHPGSIIFVNEENKVLSAFNFSGQKLDTYKRTITCPCCGKVVEVPSRSLKFTCSDEHCVSVMYSRLEKMFQKLELPVVDIEKFREFGKKYNNVVSVPDIFDMEDYKDVSIELTLPKLLDAVVPATVIPKMYDWSVFCSKCNDSLETVLYYLEHPENILTDLDLEPAIYRGLCIWLKNPENFLDVQGMLTCPNVKVITSGKRFEGAPIFRGKSIFITGKFSHGSKEDIKAILLSYSALVYDKFNTAVDCVIIGDLLEDIDGKSVQKAKNLDIPIFEESKFFAQYDIDTDIASAV